MKRFISETHPHLIQEWSNKNTIKPSDVTYGSKTKVWWVCENGHEWLATVSNRTANNTCCPYCSGRLCSPENSLLSLYPILAGEISLDGQNVDAKDIHPGTTKKYTWTCNNKHSWSASVRKRVGGKSCPTCESFGYLYPDLAKQWHPTKNPMTAFDFTPGSNKKVWWLCNSGHESQTPIYSRIKHRCPYCAGKKAVKETSFGSLHPDLARYWDSETNGTLTPFDLLPHSSKKCGFICEMGHLFQSTLSNIVLGKWCPYCSNKKVGFGNSLQDTNPQLLKEWSFSKNSLKPNELTGGSYKKVWWQCNNGHEWMAAVSSRKSGATCPYCANRLVGYGNSLKDLFPDIAKQVDYEKSPIDPTLIYARSDDRLWWKCKRGHSWKAQIKSRTVDGTGCRYCSSQTSSPEIRIFCELKSIFSDALTREKVNGMESDVLIPSLKIAIEYDGIYFHKDKIDKDLAKKSNFEALGYTVIRAREVGLLCGLHDVPIAISKEAPSKGEIDNIINIIAQTNPEVVDVCNDYLNKTEYANETEFRRILSFLPGPPEEDSLAEKYPNLALQWNYTKNFPLVPEQFHPMSGKKVWWKCEHKHEWEATIDKRAIGRSCPYCSNKKVGYGNSLAEKFPDVAKFWYQRGNGALSPYDVVFGSGAKVWWCCENGHIYKTAVVEKTVYGKLCRFCPGWGRNRKYIAPTDIELDK